MVRCADNTIYTGITNNLPLRLQRHNHGTGAGYTRGRRPVVLVYVEPSADRAAASRREHSIKRLNRWQKLRLIERQAAPLLDRGPHPDRQHTPAPGGDEELSGCNDCRSSTDRLG